MCLPKDVLYSIVTNNFYNLLGFNGIRGHKAHLCEHLIDTLGGIYFVSLKISMKELITMGSL